MRLESVSDDGITPELKIFCDRIRSIGSLGEATTRIEIPEDILIKDTTISSIVDSIYPCVLQKIRDTTYLEERMILCPRNDIVDSINQHIISMIPGKEKECSSADSLCGSDRDSFIPLEFLNIISSGLPEHKLILKVGVPIVLLRDIIDQHSRLCLCTGTRLQITRLVHCDIEAKVISGENVGQKALIRREYFIPPDKQFPFKFERLQFPIAVCFAMTINQNQGESFSHLGVYLPSPSLTHEQLCGAISRVTSVSGLKILISDEDNNTSIVVRK